MPGEIIRRLNTTFTLALKVEFRVLASRLRTARLTELNQHAVPVLACLGAMAFYARTAVLRGGIGLGRFRRGSMEAAQTTNQATLIRLPSTSITGMFAEIVVDDGGRES